MPSLAGNQVPTDLLTAVDLSAAPANQNVRSTLNDLFATITKNITDRAIRFQAPGSAPAVSAANEGALYHNGTSFQASSTGGAWEQVFTLSAQTAGQVFAGPATGGPAVPTFRALALTDLPQIATDRLLGRVASGSGEVQEITPGSGVLTWLQTPSSANLLAAVTDETGGGLANTGVLVFNESPTILTPLIADIRSGSGQTALRLTGSGSNHFVEIVNASQPTGPTIQPAGTASTISLEIKAKGSGAVRLTASAVQAVGLTSGVNTDPGILEARGGNQQFGGGKLYLYERSTNGTNYVGFEAPDFLSSDLFWTLPATDGTANQALVTDGGAGLSWASFVANSINTNRLLGRVASGSGEVQEITPGTGVLTWLQTPSSDNLAAAVSDETGSGALVFGTAPTIISPTVSTGNLNFSSVGQKLLADFSSSPLSNRFALQTTVSGGGTSLTFLPESTGNCGTTFLTNSNLAAAQSRGQFLVQDTVEMRFNSSQVNSGSVLPLRFQTADVTRLHIENNGNIGFNGNSYGTSSQGVFFIANASAVPTGNPTGGGVLYTEAGALKYRGSSGTITTLGNA